VRDDAPPPVTLEHVALAAGVSRATVSRALTGSGPVAAETLRRVRSAADALGYVGDPVARALVNGAGTRVVVAMTATSEDILGCAYLAHVLMAGALTCTSEGLGIAVRPSRSTTRRRSSSAWPATGPSPAWCWSTRPTGCSRLSPAR
jgi:DNA-binding LacI/PurR family transcriptional regulator